MSIFNFILLASDLPTLDGIESWWKQIAQQAIVIILIFLVTKHLANFKFGGIIISCVVAGIVYFVVRNWNVVSNWIEAFMQQL